MPNAAALDKTAEAGALILSAPAVELVRAREDF